jgi:hypothetical protein
MFDSFSFQIIFDFSFRPVFDFRYIPLDNALLHDFLFLKSPIDIKKAPPDFLKQKIQRNKVLLNEHKLPKLIDSPSCLFKNK